jgi:AraC-like DNA-binding protein
MPRPVFPDGCPEVILHYGDRFELLGREGSREQQPRAIVCGQLRTGIWLRSTGNAGVIGAKLRPAALPDLTDVSGQELANSIAAMPGALGSDELLDRIATAHSADERISIFEDALISRIHPRSSSLVRHAISLMTFAKGRAQIADVARSLNISRRTLERRFLHDVGLAPKEFCGVMRFRTALDHVRSTSFVETAMSSGYFDQPHLIRDFQKFAGCTPGQYLRSEFSFGAHLSHLSNTGATDSR